MLNKIFRCRYAIHAACVVLFIFLGNPASATTADSLMAALKAHPQNDTIKTNLLSALSLAYTRKNVDSAIVFANEGIAIARKNGYAKGESLCLQAIGMAYLNKNEYDKAADYYNEALQIAQKQGVKPGIARIYTYIGAIYAHQAKYGNAIEYYKKSLDLSTQINDNETEAITRSNMGSMYTDLGDYTEALKYYLDALKIIEKIGRPTDLYSSCLSNIALVYSSLGDYKRSLDYNNQSLALFRETGDKQGVLSTYVNAGVVYGEMNELRNAITMFTKGLELADSIGDKYFKASCTGDIGEAYFKLGSYDSAYSEYLVCLHEAQSTNDMMNIALPENGIGSILVKKGQIAEGIKHLLVAYGIVEQAGLKGPAQEIAMNLSEAYEKARDFTASLKYYKSYAAYTDSLYNEKNDRKIQQLQFDYELGRKENEINLLQKDKVIAISKSQRQSAIMLALLAGFFLLVIVSILLYRSRAYEKRSKEEILRQKEEIQQQAEKLEELNNFKDKTFSVLSHDLRGPINSFSSVISLLDEKMITPEEYLKLKPEMGAQVASLTILLDNLLKWSASHMKGQIAAKPVNTNIHALAEQSINLLKNPAASKQITIKNEIPASLSALCDTGQIDIVIRNLLTNAIKFTKHNGTVIISALSDNDNTFIYIADNGVGMTKEQLDKIFTIKSGNQTYGTDGEPGTGLGLLLCYEFVKANNGTISVTSEKNVGSTFTVALKNGNV